MSLELIRDAIRVNQVVGEESTQTIVENDIIVPDVKPDIARVLLLDGDVYVNGTEVMQDKILVNGVTRFKILYISEDPSQRVKSINASSNFSYGLDVPNTRSGMKCRVKCEIEHIDHTILNGRKLNVKAILRVSGKTIDEMDQNIINNISEVQDVQILRDTTRINCFVGDGSSEYTINDAMEVPAGKPSIRDILRNDIKITGRDYKITDDRIIAKGELNISTLYIGDDEEQSIQFMEHEIPFTQSIDIRGITDNASCELDYQVGDAQFEPAEDSDGEYRVLNGNITVNISASASSKRSIEVITDAYSPYVRLILDKDPFRVEDIAAENSSQIILKDTITIEGDSPEISEVFNVLCKPSLSECRVYEDKLTLEGVVKNNVLYLAANSDQPVFCYEQEIPFRHNLDLKGIKPDMACDINLDVEHCNYSMVSSSEVEVRLVLGLGVKAVSQVVMPLTVKVTEAPLEERVMENQPSIVVYFTKPGDTLWKIAKKYYTTVDYIRAMNSNISDQDMNVVGQQIIIPKKMA